jgi:hypothetical protein
LLLLSSSLALGQTLDVEGECPGELTILVAAIEGPEYVIIRGIKGEGAIPAGPCAGVEVGLMDMSWLGPFGVDPAGSDRLTPTVPESIEWMTVVDLETCAVAELEPICATSRPVGGFVVGEGRAVEFDPPVYTCLEACAEIFGGVATDYRCSTTDAYVDGMAYVDGWGDETFCTEPVPDDFSRGTSYDCGFESCSYSAYVDDHGCRSRNFCYAR